MLWFGFLLLCATLISSSSIHKQPRIVNGDVALPGQFPWQAALYVTRNEEYYFCGGVIISHEWILTAAHCLEGADTVRVHVGSVLVSGGIQIPGANMIVHADYDPDTFENDIALVLIDGELLFDEDTSAITLAENPTDPGIEVVFSGWGATSDINLEIAGALNYVFLTIISKTDCGETFGENLPDEVLCAISVDVIKGPCDGDGGGPLVSNINTLPILVGIGSFISSAGCEAGYPAGFTRVAGYRDWIKTHTNL